MSRYLQWRFFKSHPVPEAQQGKAGPVMCLTVREHRYSQWPLFSFFEPLGSGGRRSARVRLKQKLAALEARRAAA